MPLIWAALALAGLFFILLLIKLTRGALIRCFALLLLTAALTNPHLKQEDRDPLSNIALVIVDESAADGSWIAASTNGDDEQPLATIGAIEHREVVETLTPIGGNLRHKRKQSSRRS